MIYKNRIVSCIQSEMAVCIQTFCRFILPAQVL